MDSKAPSETPKTGHPKIVAALIGLATLLAVFAIFSIWANRQALNTDNWVNTSGKLLQNEDVRGQLSNYLADQLFANVNVQAELEAALPPKLEPLAGPAAGGLHQLAPQIAEKALENPHVQELWGEANRAAHLTLLKILDGEGSTVSTGGGEVKLDLSSLVAQIGGQLGVGSALASKIPAGAGQITILKSDQLSTAQSIAQAIRDLPIVLTLLALLLYGLAIYLAGPRRRRALRSAGFGFIVAGVVALIARGLAGGSVVDALAANEAVKPAAEAVWSIGTSLLVTVASSAIAFGILIVIGAWLAGPTRPATALRREASPYMREQQGATYAVAGVVWLALIAWAPIAAFHKPIGILLFALLFALGTELLRRQTLREFPDAPSAGTGDRVRGLWQGRSRAPAAPAPSEVGELERLSALRRSGDLSDAEFATAKAEILAPQTQRPDAAGGEPAKKGNI
jgi:hypothetical protein